MYCDKCGSILQEGSQFCDACGSEVLRHEAKSFWTSTTITISVAAGIFLMIGSFFIYGYFDNNPANLITTNQSTTIQSVGVVSSSLNIASINPAIVAAPYPNIIAISGSGFQSGTVVQAGTVNLDLSGAVAPNILYAKYPGNLSPGIYDITVQNLDGDKYVLNNALTIQNQTSAGSNQTAPSSPELSAAQIVSDIKTSVVLIRTDSGCGSGMIVKSNGTILTDDHVISGAGSINVYLSNGIMYRASVVSENTTQDLALIKIADAGLPTVTFGDSSDASLALGSTVTALGYPLTCNQDQTLEVDQGIVTARRTSAELGADAIQTSARINPGDSGGPLVDSYGNVVGINESIFTIENFDFNVTGIAFATPSEVIEPFISNASYYSPPQSSNSNSYGSNSAPATVSSPPPSSSRSFEVNAAGACDNDGNGTIILNGYPYVNGYSIPTDDISSWSNGKITFTVPATITPGTYRVDIRGYEPSTGFCPDVSGGVVVIQ